MTDGQVAVDMGGGGSVWRYAVIVLRHPVLTILLPVAFAVVAGVTSLGSKREYEATASFTPEAATSSLAGLSALAAQLGVGALRTTGPSLDFYADLLDSREVLRDVLLSTYDVRALGGFHGTLLDFFRIRRPTPDQAIADGIRALRARVVVSQNRLTGTVQLRVYTTNPDLSAAVADRLLALVNDFNLRQRQSRARGEREFVEQRLASASDSLNGAEDALADFERRNRRYQDSPELVAAVQRLTRRVSLWQTLYVSLAQSYESARIEEVRNTPVITVIEHPSGFVEPRARHTVLKVFLGGLTGLVLSVAYGFLRAYLGGLRTSGDPHFAEFEQSLAKAVSVLRRRASFLGGRR
jgi:uncharacterized protein involved in exopolysaccharide biosynthesis